MPTAVGVLGAEVGCPEIDDGWTLTGRARDGQHATEKAEKHTHKQSAPKQRQNDIER